MRLKAKALHEIALTDASQQLFEQISQYCLQQNTDPIFNAYLQQEKAERKQMQQGPRELNNSAVQMYQRGHWEQAFNAFSLAHQVMPKNAGIALNLWQTIMTSPRTLCSAKEQKRLQLECQQIIENSPLKPEQQRRYDQLKLKFQQPVSSS